MKASKWIERNPEKWKTIYSKRNKDPRHKIIHKKANEEHRKSGKYLNWQQNNRDKTRQYTKDRKPKVHKITDREWYDCRLYFNFRCAYCGKSWEENKKETNKDLHRDHVVFDGRNDLKNCIPACNSCNSSKGEYTLNEWYKTQSFFVRERYLAIYQWIRFDVKKYIKRKYIKTY
jgi:hypothetical protein